ncbi:MAG: HNH endonuclease signature motif containing protein [Methanosarcina sp.]
MRPVIRGPWPTDANGQKIQYKEYKNARGELIKRLGEICSYCGMHLDSSLAVEHVRPKKPEGADKNILERELDWNNFLLACANCNSTKGDVDVVLDNYFWPDRDNTILAFTYFEGGRITVSDRLDVKLKKKAEATLKLTGLDANPLKDPKASDRRWLNRKEVWEIATRSKENLSRYNVECFREQIVYTMTGHGYWSIWMTVFQDDPDMICRFINAVPGTSTDCFDENGMSLPRLGGQI